MLRPHWNTGRVALRKALPVFLVLLLLPSLVSPGFSQAFDATTGNKEVLDYAVEWRLVSAGRARLSWEGPNNEHAGFEAKLHLESSGLVSRLFRVNDDYTAELGKNFCAKATFMSAHEGSRNRETKVFYDDSIKKAIYRERDLNNNTTTEKQVAIPGCVHDVIGGLYLLRHLSMEPGKSTQVAISDGKKMVSMKVECQRREEIKTPLGPKKCVLYEVYAFNDVLYKRSGHLHIWLTDDARKLPVQIQIRLQFTIGTITLRLDKEEKS